MGADGAEHDFRPAEEASDQDLSIPAEPAADRWRSLAKPSTS